MWARVAIRGLLVVRHALGTLPLTTVVFGGREIAKNHHQSLISGP